MYFGLISWHLSINDSLSVEDHLESCLTLPPTPHSALPGSFLLTESWKQGWQRPVGLSGFKCSLTNHGASTFLWQHGV